MTLDISHSKGSLMLQPEIQDILTVLTIGIFADGKIHSNEVKVFIKSVSRLKLSNYDLPKISEAKALSWFELNKEDMNQKLSDPRSEFDAWFLPILERVGQHADKDALLHLLTMIFLADNELHNSETALIALIRRMWNLDPN